MTYLIDVKNKAILLRKQGYSLKEISNILKIAKSTSSLWTRKIQLDKKAIKRLEKRQTQGKNKALLSRKTKKQILIKQLQLSTKKGLKKTEFTVFINKLLCSIFFWTEGSKNTNCLSFINSDPKMIITFLKLIRNSFKIEENKFRALVHIHEYHNEKEILEYWSNITKIPLSKFSKSYLKPHTKKRIKDGYKGSLRIRYYDYKVALELYSIYNMFADKL